jgi:hypothetical protein
MWEREVTAIVASFAILIVITLLEMRRWLPARGMFKFVLVFLAGAAVIGALRATGMPPWWFSGEKEAFGLAISLLLGGFVAEREAGRTYGLPLLAGMGATLIVLNVLPHL